MVVDARHESHFFWHIAGSGPAQVRANIGQAATVKGIVDVKGKKKDIFNVVKA